MKKALSVILILLLAGSMVACGGSNAKEIPDVFGISYTDAITILEAEGFEVTAVATSVDGISDKLLWPLEKVNEGTVFKIDDYIIDNRGILHKNYDSSYDGKVVSKDKSVVIYYAKEDYIAEEEEPITPAPSTDASTEPAAEGTAPETTTTKPTESAGTTMGQKNAIASAKSYLEFMSFSRQGLIDQLEFEGYTTAEATYGADNCGANWKEQAAKSAESYLEFMSFSRQGLIDQLEFEGYTHEEAVYGAEAVGY